MNIIYYALRNIARNIFLSFSSIFIIGLLVFFVHILFFVIFSTDRFITSITDRIAISINLQEGYDNTQVRSIEFLSGMTESFSGIQVDYVSRGEALSILTARNPDLATLIEQDSNPLPNSIRISRMGNDLDLYNRLNVYIGRFRDIFQYGQNSLDAKLLDYRSQYDRIASVVDILQMLQIAVYILLSLFVFTVAIVIYMVIHNFVFFLQNEIRIIELVGGRPLFVYGPFVVQGIVYATLATVLASGVMLFLLFLVDAQPIPSDFVIFMRDFALLFQSYSWILIPFFAFIGAVSAFLASWKYIHSTIGE